MTQSVFHRGFLALTLIVVATPAAIAQAAQSGGTRQDQLVRYVREAKRQGIKDSKIKQQAMAAGWSSSAVDQAMADEKGADLQSAERSTPNTLAGNSRAVSETSSAPTVAGEPNPSVVDPSGATASRLANSALPRTADDYLIGSGDMLQVSVWNEQQASVPSVTVRPDGRITIPLVKEVAVAGLTPREAEAAITAALGKYISDPNVTVVVATINSKKVYMIGGVKKEGTLPYTYGMNVMQALSEAGGLTDYAKRKKIYVLRQDNGREYRLDFNYEEVLRGERMEQNVVLLPGDTVVIPQ